VLLTPPPGHGAFLASRQRHVGVTVNDRLSGFRLPADKPLSRSLHEALSNGYMRVPACPRSRISMAETQRSCRPCRPAIRWRRFRGPKVDLRFLQFVATTLVKMAGWGWACMRAARDDGGMRDGTNRLARSGRGQLDVILLKFDPTHGPKLLSGPGCL